MKIGVSPALTSDFPELVPVVDVKYEPFDMTLCLTTEMDDLWLKGRFRMLRPFFCEDVLSARAVLASLHPKKKARKVVSKARKAIKEK